MRITTEELRATVRRLNDNAIWGLLTKPQRAFVSSVKRNRSFTRSQKEQIEKLREKFLTASASKPCN
jgi:hypothetical protein